VLVIALVVSLLVNLILWRKVRQMSLLASGASQTPLPVESMGELEAIRDATSALLERLKRQ